MSWFDPVRESSSNLGARRTALQPTVAAKLRSAVEEALATGLDPDAILAAVARFAEPHRPEGILVVDPSAEMGAVYASEMREALAAEVRVATPDELDANPRLAAGLVVAVLPYHVGRVEGVASLGRLVVFTLSVSRPEALVPAGVSSGHGAGGFRESASFFPLPECRSRPSCPPTSKSRPCPVADERVWRRFLAASDVILADAVSAPRLLRAGARGLIRLKLLSEDSMARLKEALRTPVGA